GPDVARRSARTPRRESRSGRLVSSAASYRLAQLSGLAHDPAVFTWNKVLVFNLGFDRKGPRDVHWIYYPDRATVFYRVGFYDNIFDAERMSLYVEIGIGKPSTLDAVLAGLKADGVVTDQKLVAHHEVVMDPAY